MPFLLSIMCCRSDVHVLASCNPSSVSGIESLRCTYLDFIPANVNCGIQSLVDSASSAFDLILTPTSSGYAYFVDSESLAAERVRIPLLHVCYI